MVKELPKKLWLRWIGTESGKVHEGRCENTRRNPLHLTHSLYTELVDKENILFFMVKADRNPDLYEVTINPKIAEERFARKARNTRAGVVNPSEYIKNYISFHDQIYKPKKAPAV